MNVGHLTGWFLLFFILFPTLLAILSGGMLEHQQHQEHLEVSSRHQYGEGQGQGSKIGGGGGDDGEGRRRRRGQEASAAKAHRLIIVFLFGGSCGVWRRRNTRTSWVETPGGVMWEEWGSFPPPHQFIVVLFSWQPHRWIVVLFPFQGRFIFVIEFFCSSNCCFCFPFSLLRLIVSRATYHLPDSGCFRVRRDCFGVQTVRSKSICAGRFIC